jgi:predicted DNA-binding transcriptional regulator
LAKDSAVGGAIFAGSIAGIIIYGLLLVFFWEITIRVTAFLAVALLLAILAWIGYTMATTPPPEPIAEIPSATPTAKPAAPAAPAETKKESQ